MGIWKNLSISKKLFFVVGIMAVLILIELLTLRFAMDKLSAVRAFVGGEGLWTKSQKQAIYKLQRYSATKDENDYQGFLSTLSVNEGDHIARLELMKFSPDLEIVRKGFIQGQIHPDDIDPMVRLLQKFSGVSYISKAVGAWTEGDYLIDELKKLGVEYHDLIGKNKNDSAALQNLNLKLDRINDQLSVVTAEFSLVLGEGSRWLENLVFMILFSLVLTVETVGLTLTFFTSREISRGLNDLVRVSEDIGKGAFKERLTVSSHDEIGKLKIAVNKMGSLLDVSYRDLEGQILERTRKLEEIARENERLYEEAKTAVKMRDEFFSIASHELKTPITSIGLQLQLLSRELHQENIDIDKARLAADKLITMGRRLTNLEDVLMDMTKIRLGKLEIEPRPSDLTMIAQDVVREISPVAARAGSTIDLQAAESITGIFDPIRLGQVITNLINNAIKYGDGSLIEVSLRKSGQDAEISVRDHGPGIPEEKRKRIFERFERGNEDAGIAGLGLGLYISKEIAEAHGGKITLHTEVGKGSEFTVRIPLKS